SRRFFQTQRPVLWEHPDADEEGYMYGHTDNYLRVRANASDSLYNTITPALLTGFLDTETLTSTLPED
ncbi:MAG: hypothetical protein K2L11_08810, partial [Muribaculaceae bacterium]|nr:hypothetical protein [Muribaculaceae bacterium]